MKKNKLKIRTPIWSSRSIGIAAHRANADLEIQIMAKDRSGNKIFPETYIIKKEQIKKYPTQIRRGVRLYIVPIEDLEIKK
jgi:hypothetical protein